MVNPRESHAAQDWPRSELDPDWDDDLIDIDDISGIEDYLGDQPVDDALGSIEGLAAWRRIEIAKESSKLRSVLREFSDIEDYEYLPDEEFAEYSY